MASVARVAAHYVDKSGLRARSENTEYSGHAKASTSGFSPACTLIDQQEIRAGFLGERNGSSFPEVQIIRD